MTTPFNTAPSENPFAVAVAPPSIFPKISQLSGILLLIKPIKAEMVYENMRFVKPGQAPQLVERMSADVETVDAVPAGFDINVFPSMYISGSRLITQLRGNLATGQPILGRLGLYKPGEPAGAGNPWGLSEPTQADVELALRYVNGTHRPQVGASPYVQAASNSSADVQLANQINQAANQAVTAGMIAQAQPTPLHQGSNPFAQ